MKWAGVITWRGKGWEKQGIKGQNVMMGVCPLPQTFSIFVGLGAQQELLKSVVISCSMRVRVGLLVG